MLPSRSDLLRSVHAADLVGFHTYDLARHFVSAYTRILGLEGTPEGVEDQGRLTRVAAFPIGIDSDLFIRALELPHVKTHMKELKERFAGRKDRSLDFHALCALYAVTDVALVTSLRDGMNLVSYEFVASQATKKGVLILSEFAGAAQSLGAGAILVNPWNITEVAAAIGYALNMAGDEREKRHHHNFKHVTSHTSQEWAATFVSKLNDTIVEAQLRTRQVTPLLPIKVAADCFMKATNRLLILGFNATLTEPLNATLRRRGGQIRDMDPKLNPEFREPLRVLCDDPKTTVIVLSESQRTNLAENFGEYDIWLAAENGMFLRYSKANWMTTMPENLNMDWIDSVQHVFEYFTERTPRSHFEYSDLEFGRLQARDMLQHLWTGPISNAQLDVAQGGRSVEVRAVGLTKGAAIDRILGEIVHNKGMTEPIDYVLCAGHFLSKDEDIFTFFEPEFPPPARPRDTGTPRPSSSTRPVSKASFLKKQRSLSTLERRATNHLSAVTRHSTDRMTMNEGSSILDLTAENYFSCAVARKNSTARYLLRFPSDVVTLIKELSGRLQN